MLLQKNIRLVYQIDRPCFEKDGFGATLNRRNRTMINPS